LADPNTISGKVDEMKIMMFWSCAGFDASDLSFGTAKLLSGSRSTLIVELPCLGIPRLGFVSGVMDPERNTEAAVAGFESNRSLRSDLISTVSKRLHVLSASVHGPPDCLLALKVEVEILAEFVTALKDLGKNMDCEYLILECQGQISSPLSFFSLKLADRIIIPLAGPSDVAYALSCVKRLAQVYEQPAEKFILAYSAKAKAVRNAVHTYQKEDQLPEGLRLIKWDCKKIARILCKELELPEASPDMSRMNTEEKTKLFSGTGRHQKRAFGSGFIGRGSLRDLSGSDVVINL